MNNLIKDRDDILIVASSDLSHFYSQSKAEKLVQGMSEKEKLKLIEALEGS